MVRSAFKAFVVTTAMAGAFTIGMAPAADAKVVIKVKHGHHWGGYHHYKPYRHYGHGYGGYYGGYGGYGGCYLKPKRVWTPYGWAWSQRTVCY